MGLADHTQPRAKASRSRPIALALTGDAQLDKTLEEIAGEEGRKSIAAAIKQEIKAAVREIVLPDVLEKLSIGPGRTDGGRAGHLADQIVVRSARLKDGKVGFSVGFRDPLFKGPTFYAGFIEFGWDHRLGFHVEADSFLRESLYPNETKIVAQIRERLRALVAELNAGGGI